MSVRGKVNSPSRDFGYALIVDRKDLDIASHPAVLPRALHDETPGLAVGLMEHDIEGPTDTVAGSGIAA
jgi:hypothetical protein